MSSCLGDQTIVDLLEHRLDAQARAQAETHMESCDACRRLLAAAVASASPAHADSTARPAPVRGACVGRYVLLEAIGVGSMGVVYSAFDPELHREVALKLVRTGEAPEERNARVLREARAMARLSHPNVITVHDVGPFGDEVFVAMELVRGTTLRAWLAKTPRDWRSVLGVFLQAGRGLAAAHAAGIVHRDFKPDNVLVGEDGRARVTDFGLARWQDPGPSPPAERSEARPALVSAVAGTPAYMAPEQSAGYADAASDQYSFCVALRESLPADTRMPAAIRAALTRGLQRAPAERHPSMDDLLAQLAAAGGARSRAWARAFGTALAFGACALGVAFAARSPATATPPTLCTGAEQRLVGIWDDDRKEGVARALRTTGKSFAEDTWKAVEGTLDTYGHAWTAARTDACEATRVRGEQSEAVLDRRMQCLDRRLVELRVLVEVLSRADESVLEKAAQSTLGLTPVSACSALAVGGGADQGVDPAVAEALAQSQALRGTGQYDAAEEAAQSALRLARSRDPQGTAEPLGELGEIAIARQDGALAEERYVDALAAAQRSELSWLVARAEQRLGWAFGVFQSLSADADRWFRLAESALDRLGEEADPDRALLLTGRAYTKRHAGHSREAVEDSRAAIRLLEERLPGDWRSLASARNALGTSLDEIDETDEAEEQLTRALQGYERQLGPMHPSVAAVLNNLARVEIDQGKYEEARATEERGVAIGASSEVPAHMLSRAWLQMSDALSRMGRFDEARSSLARALDVAQAMPTAQPRLLAFIYGQQGALERLEGRYDQALGHLQLALDLMDRSLGPHHPDSVGPVCDLGLLYLARGQVAAAIPRLQDALSLAEGRSDCLPGRLGLAQALWQTGRDRPRARTLVKEEREYFRAHPARAGEVRDMELWFEKHAPEIDHGD